MPIRIPIRSTVPISIRSTVSISIQPVGPCSRRAFEIDSLVELPDDTRGNYTGDVGVCGKGGEHVGSGDGVAVWPPRVVVGGGSDKCIAVQSII